MHEPVKIVKDSDFITRRFFLSPQYKEGDYSDLGGELTKLGGFSNCNIPKDIEFNIDEIMKELLLNLTEIFD